MMLKILPKICLQNKVFSKEKQGTFGFQVQSRCFLFKGREIKKRSTKIILTKSDDPKDEIGDIPLATCVFIL